MHIFKGISDRGLLSFCQSAGADAQVFLYDFISLFHSVRHARSADVGFVSGSCRALSAVC